MNTKKSLELTEEQLRKINGKVFDLEALNSKYEELIDCFRYKIWVKEDVALNVDTFKEILSSVSNEYIDERRHALIAMSWKYLRNNKVSILSPAFNFNQLIKTYIDYLQNIDERCPMSNIEYIEYFCSIHTCLISIKTSLDRVSQLFSYYYRCIPKYMTFGHIDSKGKYTNFLSVANQIANSNKDGAEIFKYILGNYNDWIKECVAPRDQIIHYEDVERALSCNEEFELFEPIGMSRKDGSTVNMETIKKYMEAFYSFIDRIFEYLLFETQIVPPCDFNGLYLPSDKVKTYFDDPTYNPYTDTSLKSIFDK